MSGKPEILVAEDSMTQATQFQFLLEEAGYFVRLASDGREAVEAVRANQPDLVVTDLVMPEMNGLEVVQTLQQEYPKLPVVLITARGSESIAAKALQHGATSYVPKQDLDSVLIPTLERILAVIAADRYSKRLGPLLDSFAMQYHLDNDLSVIPILIARFQDELRQLGLCDEGGAIQVATALDEALLNAIVHGNLEVSSELRAIDDGSQYMEAIQQRQAQKPYRDRRVIVTLTADRDAAKFVIEDQGPGFSVHDVPDPTDPENFANVSGRGLALINAFMNHVEHNDTGNRITMIKSAKGDSDDD